MGHLYDHLKKRQKKRLAETGNAPVEEIKKTDSKQPHNLIPACVYWYVGNCGEVLDAPRGADLKRTTHDLLKRHLLDPCGDKIPVKIRADYARDARALEQRILRVDRELRG